MNPVEPALPPLRFSRRGITRQTHTPAIVFVIAIELEAVSILQN